MSDDFAAPVKGIIKALDAGIRLAKRVSIAATTCIDANQALRISESAQNLRRILERSRLVINDAYKQTLEESGEAFAQALTIDDSLQGRLQQLRIDLIDQIDECQDFDEKPGTFESIAFDRIQHQSQRCRAECLSIFNVLSGRIQAEAQKAVQDDRLQLSSMKRKPVSTAAAQPPPSHIATLLNEANADTEKSKKEKAEEAWSTSGPYYHRPSSPGQNPPPTYSPQDVQPPPRHPLHDNALPAPLRLIPKEVVNSRISANDEFLARRRISRMMFQDEIGHGIIEENQASDTFSEGSNFMSGYASSSSPLERNSSIASGSSYNDFVTRKRSQLGSSATRSSRGSSSMRSKADSDDGYMARARSHGQLSQGARSSIFENEEATFSSTPSARRPSSSALSPLTSGFPAGIEDGIEVAIPDAPEAMAASFYDAPEVVPEADPVDLPMLASELTRSQSTRQVMPPPPMKPIDNPMRHDSSFFRLGGFCEGAKAMMRGETGFKVVKKPSSHQGHYSSVLSARCIRCAYEVGWNDVEKDRLLDRAGIYGNSGIRWRQKFISKCHVKSSSVEEPIYGCIFCVEENKTVEENDATVFFSVAALFRHLAKHARPLPNVSGIMTLYGQQPSSALDFDVHFPSDEPQVSVYSIDKIASKVSTRASAQAIMTYNPKPNSKVFKDPEGNETLHFAEGARIVGISFPDNFNGQWCMGYHDGERGSFPANTIVLEMPNREEVQMNAQSTLVATARWDFKLKDSKEGGWLKFSKGDKITSVGYSFVDQWCWSGSTSKGKWGLFPSAFVEDLKDSGGVPAPAGTSRGFSLKGRMPSFPLSRNRSHRQERAASVRSTGSNESRPSSSAQPGLEVVATASSSDGKVKPSVSGSSTASASRVKKNLERDGILF